MTWWQILLAVILNVPWLCVFFICVVLPAVRTTISKFDKEQFWHTAGACTAALTAASAVVLLLSVVVLLVMGDTIPNPHKLSLTIVISGGITLLSGITLIILNRRR